MQRVKTFKIIVHASGCILFLFFPLIFTGDGSQSAGLRLICEKTYWQFCISFIVLFYINYGILTPKILANQKYFTYISAIILAFCFFYWLRPYDDLMNYHRQLLDNGLVNNGSTKLIPPKKTIDIVTYLLFFLTIGIGVAIYCLEIWRSKEHHLILAQSEKNKAELSFLKAQINPHFLFNTLNNIYTLSVIGDSGTPESILKLSNVMRYVTDEATQNWVPLNLEIGAIQNYIALQKLKLSQKDEVMFEVEGTITDEVIPPLVLLAFVENAFKHGISKREQNIFHITLKISNKCILFSM